MDQWPDTIWVFAGTVLAAIIVMFSGWFQQRISRASTVSGYRQKWIQDIRDAFLAYLAELEKLSDAASSNSDSKMCFGARSTILEDMQSIRAARYYLQLYTNPHERRHKAFIENALAIERYLTDTVRNSLSLSYFEEQRAKLMLSAQGILKEEWDRVKMGELRWRARRYFRCITNRCS